MWEACRVPFMPELFSGRALAQFYDKRRRDELEAVPYFDGLMAGEPDALVQSFAAEPELHDPVRGRVKGTRAFGAFVTEMNAWIARRNIAVENVAHVVTEQRGFEEVVLHLEGETARVELLVAIVADREHDGHIDELRIYFSTWALTRRHANRPPLLQPDPELRAPDIVSEHQEALAAGDVDAIVAAFEPEGYAPRAGGQPVSPHGPRWPALLLPAVVLKRRRYPPGTLRADRRKGRVRARVQRGAVGPDGAVARGRCRCLRTGSERETRRGTHIR
jgi:hypothetical protein